jgi:hypothetical protein
VDASVQVIKSGFESNKNTFFVASTNAANTVNDPSVAIGFRYVLPNGNIYVSNLKSGKTIGGWLAGPRPPVFPSSYYAQ